MTTIQPTKSTQQRVARLYVDVIGYDPFEDDPSATVQEVICTLREYREEVRNAAKGN